MQRHSHTIQVLIVPACTSSRRRFWRQPPCEQESCRGTIGISGQPCHMRALSTVFLCMRTPSHHLNTGSAGILLRLPANPEPLLASALRIQPGHYVWPIYSTPTHRPRSHPRPCHPPDFAKQQPNELFVWHNIPVSHSLCLTHTTSPHRTASRRGHARRGMLETMGRSAAWPGWARGLFSLRLRQTRCMRRGVGLM